MVLGNVLINGVMYSWADLVFSPYGVPLIGITKIEYKITQKKENVKGQGVEPIGRSYGDKEYAGSIEIYKENWNAFIAAAPNSDPLAIPFTDMPLSYGTSANSVISTEILQAVEWLEDEMKANQGDMSLKVTVPFIFAGIKRL
jgi:hypothetical protein